MEKYGFIYIWRDKKHKKLYIGCHWGTEDDGYVCSSTNMRNNYRNRPQDFRRKIVHRVYTNRHDLHEAEHQWLQLIPDEELGRKFYNKSKHKFGHWTAREDKEEIKRVVSRSVSLLMEDPEHRRKISESTRRAMASLSEDKKSDMSSKMKASWTEERRAHQTELNKRQRGQQRGRCDKISVGLKAWYAEGNVNAGGLDALATYRADPERVAACAAKRRGLKRSDESRKNMSDAAKGRSWKLCKETGVRVFFRKDIPVDPNLE